MTSTRNPFFSLIIPTRERSRTLACAIRTALEQTSRDIQVIVSDNASTDDTPAVVRSFEDPRLEYVRTPARVSMSDNYEFALNHARGEFVTFIGDDDAFVPGAIDRLEAFVRQHPAQLYTWPKHGYVWPIDSRPAQVTHLAAESSPRVIDLRQPALKVAARGGEGFTALPNVYHSLVARQVTDRIRNSIGRVFPALAPDLFTALAIPAFADKAFNVGFHVTVNGASAKSYGGAAYASDGAEVCARFLREYGDYQFHRRLIPDISNPFLYLIPDTVLTAIDKFPNFYGGVSVDYTRMWLVIHRMRLGCRAPLSRYELLRNAAKIRKYHPFSPARLALMWTLPVHRIPGLWPKVKTALLARREKYRKLTEEPPATIGEFALAVARSQGLGGGRAR